MLCQLGMWDIEHSFALTSMAPVKCCATGGLVALEKQVYPNSTPGGHMSDDLLLLDAPTESDASRQKSGD